MGHVAPLAWGNYPGHIVDRTLWRSAVLPILELVVLPALPHRSRILRRSDKGGALVEFAIAFPIFMLLLLAVVDMGVNFGDKVETAHASREAARAGSVSKVGTDTSCDLDPNGTLAVLTEELFCLAKARTHMDTAEVRVKVFYEGVNGKETTNYDPVPPALSATSTIVVCLMSNAKSISGMLSTVFDGNAHESRALIKNGRPQGGVYPPPGEENPLPGQDWSFCSAEDPVGTDAF